MKQNKKKDMNTKINELIATGSSFGKINFILKNEKFLTEEDYDKVLSNFIETVTTKEYVLLLICFSRYNNEVIKILEAKAMKELSLTDRIPLLTNSLCNESLKKEILNEFLKSKDKKLIINLLMTGNELPLEEKRRLVDKLGLNVFISMKVKMLLNMEYLDEDEIPSIVDYIIKHSKANIKLLVLRICIGLPINEVKKLSISIINDYKNNLDAKSILNILIFTGSIDIDMMEEIINITGIKELLDDNYDLIGAMLNSELNNENLNIDTLKKLRFLHSYLYGESIQIAKPKRLILKANKTTGE